METEMDKSWKKNKCRKEKKRGMKKRGGGRGRWR